MSTSTFRLFSKGRMPLSASTWMKGSLTVLGGAVRSVLVQHRSKSPAEMILLSTKILYIDWPAVVHFGAGRRGWAVFEARPASAADLAMGRKVAGGGLDGEIGGLVFDFLQRGLDVGIVGKALEDGFVFEDGGGKLAELDVSLGDAFGGADDVLLPAELGIGFLEDFQGLIVVRLRLSDDFKHLNRLRQLGFFARA